MCGSVAPVIVARIHALRPGSRMEMRSLRACRARKEGKKYFGPEEGLGPLRVGCVFQVSVVGWWGWCGCWRDGPLSSGMAGMNVVGRGAPRGR